ncbi:hypothetical protein Hdeb2414_s0009g00314051 [Helianthus debilis subsp. tardiflorus]
MVITLGSWKDRFFWVSESIVPFKMVWRHPDAVLNELEPSDSELDSWFLKSISACPSRLRPFPKPLLSLMGISKLWDKPDRDPVLMRDGQGMHFVFLTLCYFIMLLFMLFFPVSIAIMSALDFIKSDDTSDVVFADAASAKGEDVVVSGSEHRFDGSNYVGVPNVKGFVKAPASKQSTRRSTRRKGVGQPSTSKNIDLVDDLEKEDTEVPDDGKKCELPLVVGKDVKAVGKKVGGPKPSTKAIKGSSMLIRGKYMRMTRKLQMYCKIHLLFVS